MDFASSYRKLRIGAKIKICSSVLSRITAALFTAATQITAKETEDPHLKRFTNTDPKPFNLSHCCE